MAREAGFEPAKMLGSKPSALDQLGDSPTNFNIATNGRTRSDTLHNDRFYNVVI